MLLDYIYIYIKINVMMNPIQNLRTYPNRNKIVMEKC